MWYERAKVAKVLQRDKEGPFATIGPTDPRTRDMVANIKVQTGGRGKEIY